MDPVRNALDTSLARATSTEAAVFTDLGEMLERTGPDVLLACPIIEAHGAAVRAGLEAGCHVLSRSRS